MFSTFIKKKISFGKLIFGIFISLVIFSSCEHELPVENQSDTTPTASVKNLNATAGDKTVFLSWTNPSDSDFYGTRITFTPSVYGVSQPVVIEGEYSENSSTVFNGLKNGVEYTFTLVALDKNQNKSKSVSIKATPKEPADTTPPKEVTELKAEIGDKSVTLTWKNPYDSDFMSTQITFTPRIDGVTQPITVEGKSSQTSTTTIDGLEYDTEYSFTLKTIDKKQNQSQGVQIKATPTDKIPPEKIETITTVAGDKSVTLSWTNPSASDFEGIQITFTPEVSYIPQPLVVRGEPNKTSDTTISGLQNDTTYTFKLTAFDKVGNKSETVFVKASPCDKTPPAEVTNLTTTAHSESITLNWTNPSDIDFYAIEISSNPAGWGLDEPLTIQGSTLEQKSYTISNLNNGFEYTFIIKTIDTNGNKSKGKKIETSVIASEISLLVELPNDNENIVFTNDTAPINLSVNSAYKIKKAIWTKHNENTSENPEDLINDTSAEEIPITGLNSNTTLYAKENGTYDIAIQDEENEIVVEQIEIRTIDKTPLPEVSNLMIICEGGTNYTISWKNPQPEDSYDAPLKEVQLSCIFNNDANDINNKSISFNPSIENYTFSISEKKDDNDFMNVYIHNIDEASNKSSTTNYIIYCKDHCVSTNDKNADSIPIYDGENTEIIIYGNTCYHFRDKIQSLNDSSNNTTVSLDLRYMSGLNSIDFRNCSRITNIQLSNEIKSINSRAFYGCSSLTSINIPNGVTSIAYDAFSGCSSLTSISIPSSVTSIGDRAFSGCSSLTSISIPSSVTSIGGSAFSGCSSLTSISIPCKITSIDGYTFKECSRLTDITIPNGVTRIGESAFYGCSSLISINIPNSVTQIASQAFWECENVVQITIDGKIFDILNVNVLGGLEKSLKKIIFTNSLPQEFQYWNKFEKLESIIIPDNITSIEDDTFKNCSTLKTITIPDTVTSIGNNAFRGCKSLTDINIPQDVTQIGSGAFYNCSSLTEVYIPSTVKSIGSGTFEYCINLEDINIQNGITSIEAFAFFGCKNLKNINIPDSVISIGMRAFSGCSKLTEIIIPNGVASIEEGLFKDCGNLTNISIPSGVTSIGKDAFYNCRSLKNITIPSSVTLIDKDAFYDCYLSSATFQDCSSWHYIDEVSEKHWLTTIGIDIAKNAETITKYRNYAFIKL